MSTAPKIAARHSSEDHSGMVHVSDAVRWIENNIAAQDATLTRMARNLGLSRSHFGRLIVEETGRSFREHLKFARVERAARLLAETRKTVKEISWEVGYTHASNFVRDFRGVKQITPISFRIRNVCKAGG